MSKFYSVGSPISDQRGYIKWPDIMRIINTVDSLRDKALIMTLAFTGRRVSEIVGIKRGGRFGKIEGGIRPRDIDTSKNTIVFRLLKRKGHPEQIVPVSSKLVSYLSQYCEARQIKHNERIFPISRWRVFRIVRKWGARAGIDYVGRKKIHPHHFRHSYAVHLVDIIGIKKLQHLLGHGSITTTAHYLKFSQEDIQKDLERIF